MEDKISTRFYLRLFFKRVLKFKALMLLIYLCSPFPFMTESSSPLPVHRFDLIQKTKTLKSILNDIERQLLFEGHRTSPDRFRASLEEMRASNTQGSKDQDTLIRRLVYEEKRFTGLLAREMKNHPSTSDLDILLLRLKREFQDFRGLFRNYQEFLADPRFPAPSELHRRITGVEAYHLGPQSLVGKLFLSLAQTSPHFQTDQKLKVLSTSKEILLEEGGDRIQCQRPVSLPLQTVTVSCDFRLTSPYIRSMEENSLASMLTHAVLSLQTETTNRGTLCDDQGHCLSCEQEFLTPIEKRPRNSPGPIQYQCLFDFSY